MLETDRAFAAQRGAGAKLGQARSGATVGDRQA
jgi:hypothetical protein